VVTPKIGSGTRQLVEDSVIGPFAKRRSTEASVRPDATTVPSDQVMLAEVIKDPSALAFAGFATVQPWKDSVRTIAIDGGSGCVTPTVESIRDGKYPLSRSLYAYVDVDDARDNPTVGAFADDLVQAAVDGDASSGVIPLDSSQAEATADAWDAAMSDGDVTGS
jgi:phosphate transport system substrate-binding protein